MYREIENYAHAKLLSVELDFAKSSLSLSHSLNVFEYDACVKDCLHYNVIDCLFLQKTGRTDS